MKPLSGVGPLCLVIHNPDPSSVKQFNCQESQKCIPLEKVFNIIFLTFLCVWSIELKNCKL